MDFFGAQDRAKSNSLYLVSLFSLAVGAVALLLTLLVGLIDPKTIIVPDIAPSARDFLIEGRWSLLWQSLDWLGIAKVAAAMALFLGTMSLAKSITLRRGGGRAVAESLGGVKLDPLGGKPEYRALCNIVAEMALAAGIPAPPVYVLRDETCVNAFAAGYGPEDAVIGITEGALTHLNRDELQGVIAHEFSHILYGDMRLNIRLMGLLFGILAVGIGGEILLRATPRRSGRKNNGVAVIFLAGLALYIIGYVGHYLAHLIRCAISRQREFLADAASAQFTRNPRALASALIKIQRLVNETGSGDLSADSARVGQMSHMFFTSAIRRGLMGLAATHPPLATRVARLRGLPDPTPTVSSAPASGDDRVSSLVGGASPELTSIMDAVMDPIEASTVILAMLVSSDPTIRERQLGEVSVRLPSTLAVAWKSSLERTRDLPRRDRLRTLDLAMPALTQLSGPQRARVVELMERLILADGRLDIFEYLIVTLTRRRLGVEFMFLPSKPFDGSAAEASRIVLSTLESVSGRQNSAQTLSADSAKFHAALRRLEREPERLRRGFVNFAMGVINSDGAVTDDEAEMIRAVAAALSVPCPNH